MSITKTSELQGMRNAGEAVAITLREMRQHARPGMSTKQLDDFGAGILKKFGARSAPALAYQFPGCTCISVNEEIAHGIPSRGKVLKAGDLINIDVSAERNGYWADNGGSFVLGEDINGLQPLVDASRRILRKVLESIRSGVGIAEVGSLIERESRRDGYRVIRNLTGHGIGRSLHEHPQHIPNYRDPFVGGRFRKNSVVAVETFISTTSSLARTQPDGWTLVGNRGGYVAQHEHTIAIADGAPIVFTEMNDIFAE